MQEQETQTTVEPEITIKALSVDDVNRKIQERLDRDRKSRDPKVFENGKRTAYEELGLSYDEVDKEELKNLIASSSKFTDENTKLKKGYEKLLAEVNEKEKMLNEMKQREEKRIIDDTIRDSLSRQPKVNNTEHIIKLNRDNLVVIDGKAVLLGDDGQPDAKLKIDDYFKNFLDKNKEYVAATERIPGSGYRTPLVSEPKIQDGDRRDDIRSAEGFNEVLKRIQKTIG